MRTPIAYLLVFFSTIVLAGRPRPEWRPERALPRVVQPPPPPAKPELVGPLTGSTEIVTAPKGKTLLDLARAHNTDPVTLARLNSINGEKAPAGMQIILPSRHIVPMEPRDGVVINIPERGAYVFRNGKLLARYPTAVGMRTWETPVGQYKVVQKVIDPVWIPPQEMVKQEGVPTKHVPAGKDNPIGDRWMGWSAKEVGFHSTWAVDSIGQAASHACVRLFPEAAHKMFNQVYIGMPIYAIYEPIKIGRGPEGFYLSVSPDLYHRGLATPERVMKKLDQAGLKSRVIREQVHQIAARQDGYPHLIVPAQASIASAGSPSSAH